MSPTRCPYGRAVCHVSLFLSATAFGATTWAAPEVVSPTIEVRTDPPPAPRVPGRPREVLDAPVAGLAWRNVPLRDALRDVGEAFGVAVVRDRRIDPTRPVEVEASGVSLLDVLAEVSGDAGAELRVVGNAVYMGPSDAAEVVRTLAELRRTELEGVRDRRLATRRAALLRGGSVGWGDLTEPAEALRLLSERFGLKVENAEVLPHDLWPGVTLTETSAAEALTLLLIQFDLTFVWSDDLASIRLASLPNRSEVAVERSYSTRGAAEATAREWRERCTGLDARAEGGKVLVRGTVELHEEVERTLVQGGGARWTAEPRPPENPPLGRRRFTLNVSRVPARAVMGKLEESGIAFEYDEGALTAAGVDLETPVTFDVKQAEARPFFEALFSPIGVDFEVAGNTVRLRVSAGVSGRPDSSE